VLITEPDTVGMTSAAPAPITIMPGSRFT